MLVHEFKLIGYERIENAGTRKLAIATSIEYSN